MKPYLDPEEQHSILLGNTGRDRFPSRTRAETSYQRVAAFSKEGVMSSSSIQMGQLSIIPGPRGDHRLDGFEDLGRWLVLGRRCDGWSWKEEGCLNLLEMVIAMFACGEGYVCLWSGLCLLVEKAMFACGEGYI
ncbi:hypothetical protein LAZ67_1007489 [Cordylochernes scorpioides]|uniref:Uncharacterized protein n=1 Tax=Cordylochernes scorpioides TaxID=51811 RepID=A0ABY6K2X4_9ARAC|nr:hypothetical protein LAZ67_1007489 [Cordylochernes scorpioides]